jgi:hypothetical protein
MTKTAWHDLPNALHIDRILADLQRNFLAWDAAWYAAAEADAAGDVARLAAWYAARDAAGDAARYAARDAARASAGDAARLAARDAAWYAAGDAAWYAILALIAWDDSAKFLDMTPDQLRFWIALSDDPKATLLLPAVVALAPELAMA